MSGEEESRASQMLTMLSLAPEARYAPSKRQVSPQTSPWWPSSSAILCPDVVVPDTPVAVAQRDDMAVPGERWDLSTVAGHGAELRAGLDVPELNGAVRVGDDEEGAVCGEGDGGDKCVAWGVSEVGDGTGVGALGVRGLAEGDGDDVLGGPGDEVEVEIVDHVGCFEHALRLGRELAGLGGAAV